MDGYVVGLSVSKNLDHGHSTVTSKDCTSCHGTSTTAKIIGYDHANPPTGIKCVYCHFTSQSVLGIAVKTKGHNGTGLNKDCNSSGCHNPTFPTWNGKAWLNFHIFCGIMGPIAIFFHCKLNVRGLVAISFWSMIVSLTSGIIGRYLYTQLLSTKKYYEMLLEKIDSRINRIFEKNNLSINANDKNSVFSAAINLSGVSDSGTIPSAFTVLWNSLLGDLRLSVQTLTLGPQWPLETRDLVIFYAKPKRKIVFWNSFQTLMGYWHTLHFPFAAFMYLASFIHVIAALIFGVK